MTNPVVIVACGARKADRPAPAHLLYTGPFVRATLRWARSVTSTDRIFILSARYGLVAYDQVIAPYEQTLRKPGAVPDTVVREQAIRFGILDEPIIVAAGADYVALLRRVWGPGGVHASFGRERGQHSQGQFLQALKTSGGMIP